MRTGILVILLFLQSFAYAGSVCGEHLTAAESADCCQKGHISPSGKTTLTDSTATSCCGSCDSSKSQLLKRQDLQISAVHIVTNISDDVVVMPKVVSPFVFADFHRRRASHSDPPKLFLLKESFLI